VQFWCKYTGFDFAGQQQLFGSEQAQPKKKVPYPDKNHTLAFRTFCF